MGCSRRKKYYFGGVKVSGIVQFVQPLSQNDVTMREILGLWDTEKRWTVQMAKNQKSYNQYFLCMCGCQEFSM